MPIDLQRSASMTAATDGIGTRRVSLIVPKKYPMEYKILEFNYLMTGRHYNRLRPSWTPVACAMRRAVWYLACQLHPALR